jgi:DNA-binding Lrp family transcriptional regulator
MGREGKRRSSGFRVTDRDKTLIRFLARYRTATYSQVATYLGITESSLRHRIPTLERADLIAVYRGGTDRNLLGATANGLRVVGLDLPVYDPSYAGIVHTLALTDLGIYMEKAGETVLTEREIRAAKERGEISERIRLADEWQSAPVTYGDSDAHRGLFVVPPPFGKTTGMRIPDMVLARPLAPDGSSRSVGIEMELALKEKGRYDEIIASYHQRGRQQFGGILYYTPYADVSSAVTRAIERAGAGDFIGVRHYQPTTQFGFS